MGRDVAEEAERPRLEPSFFPPASAVQRLGGVRQGIARAPGLEVRFAQMYEMESLVHLHLPRLVDSERLLLQPEPFVAPPHLPQARAANSLPHPHHAPISTLRRP